jgi:pimeloyl-ACP methyl ester carboxylesterase
MSAAWLDGSDLEPHLRMLPWRCIAPTLYGFGPQARHRFELSMDDHLVLLQELLHTVAAETRPEIVVFGGFSSAGDVVLRLAARADNARHLDGVLALGPNQALETCFVSRVLARLDTQDPSRLLKDLAAVSEGASSLDDWIIMNGYLGRIMARFRNDLAPLRTLASDIIEPYQQDDRGAFAAMYRAAAARVKTVRCVFEDSEPCNRLLRQALLDHMDRGVLGDRYRDGALLIEPTPSHFELMEPDRVARHLSAMVEELRTSRR